MLSVKQKTVIYANISLPEHFRAYVASQVIDISGHCEHFELNTESLRPSLAEIRKWKLGQGPKQKTWSKTPWWHWVQKCHNHQIFSLYFKKVITVEKLLSAQKANDLEFFNGWALTTVAYASRSLTPIETHYTQIEKELLSVVFAAERFHQYIYICKGCEGVYWPQALNSSHEAPYPWSTCQNSTSFALSPTLQHRAHLQAR